MQPRYSLFRFALKLALPLLASASAFGAPVVNLAWDASSDTNVTGYYIYYGPALGNYTHRLDAGTNLNLTTPALPDGPYYFTATSRSAQGVESDFANVITTNIITFPTIVSQPASLTVSAGSNAVFSVNSPNGFLSFFWFRNGTNLTDGGNVSGATTSNLTLANAAVSDAATYSVVVSNSVGVVQSSNATLTVFIKPTIQQDPQSATIFVGVNETLSVVATGDAPLSYQWQKGGTDIPNATDSAYNIASARTSDTGLYRCIIHNPAPDSATSAGAQLTVLPDITPPVVKTTWPTANSSFINGIRYTNHTFVTTAPDVPLSGMATDNGIITNITVTRTVPPWAVGPIAITPVGSASAKTWTNVTRLVDGTNVFQITATDSAGLTSTLLRTIYLRTTNKLTVVTNGYGTAVPAGSPLSARNGASLELGRNYSIRAVPKTGNWFVNWTDASGGVISTNTTLTFRMTNNLSLTANFVTNEILAAHLAGTYNGLFAESDAVRTSSAGALMNLTLSSNRKFSGRLHLAGATNSFSGIFDITGNATKTILRGIKPSVTISMSLDFINGTQQITGSVACVTEDWSSPLLANLGVYSTKQPSPTAGRYTMAIPPLPSRDTNSPIGYGYGLITNSPTGHVTMTGALADSTAISCSATTSKYGDWPVCVDLYSRQGLLYGWVNLSNGSPTGRLSWIKPSQSLVPNIVNKMYPEGVDDTVSVFGSIYRMASPTIALPAGALEVEVPAVVSTSYPIAVTNNNVIVSPVHITGSVSASTGLVTLNLPSTVTGGVVRSARGVVLQSSNIVVGTVGGTNAAIYLH